MMFTQRNSLRSGNPEFSKFYHIAKCPMTVTSLRQLQRRGSIKCGALIIGLGSSIRVATILNSRVFGVTVHK